MTVEEAQDRIHRALLALESRYVALSIYGFMAFFAGALMTFTGAPGAIEATFGPESRVALGVPLALAGVGVLAGSFWADEKLWAWRSAAAGSLLFGLWSAALTAAYLVAGLHEGFDAALPFNPIPRESARPYVLVIYQGIMLLQFLHLATLLRIGRPRR